MEQGETPPGGSSQSKFVKMIQAIHIALMCILHVCVNFKELKKKRVIGAQHQVRQCAQRVKKTYDRGLSTGETVCQRLEVHSV